MGFITIMKRGGDDVKRFEDAIYDAKESVMEICEIFEEMKSRFSDEDAPSYGERSYHRYEGRSGYGERDDYRERYAKRERLGRNGYDRFL
jgi:hypothetical protein